MSSPRILTLCFVAFLVAGCSYVETTPPPPTPADFGDTVTRFVTRGVQIDHVVSGDAGCKDKALAPTAIAFNASGLDQATPVRIYLYRFADRATFERLRATRADPRRHHRRGIGAIGTTERQRRELPQNRCSDVFFGRAIAETEGNQIGTSVGQGGDQCLQIARQGMVYGWNNSKSYSRIKPEKGIECLPIL